MCSKDFITRRFIPTPNLMGYILQNKTYRSFQEVKPSVKDLASREQNKIHSI